MVLPPAHSNQLYLEPSKIIQSPVLSLTLFKVEIRLCICTFLIIEVCALLCQAPREQSRVSPLST